MSIVVDFRKARVLIHSYFIQAIQQEYAMAKRLMIYGYPSPNLQGGSGAEVLQRRWWYNGTQPALEELNLRKGCILLENQN
jgi:hypothetical protein